MSLIDTSMDLSAHISLAPLAEAVAAVRGAVALFKRETDGRGHLLLASQMMQMTRDDDLALRLLVAIQRGIEFGARIH